MCSIATLGEKDRTITGYASITFRSDDLRTTRIMPGTAKWEHIMEAWTSRTGYSQSTVTFIIAFYGHCTFAEPDGKKWRLIGWQSILDRATYVETETKGN